MRYIGSKSNLLNKIEDVINENINDNSKIFMDIFSGTASVANHFKKDYKIISNDKLYFSYILQKSVIENNTIPEFKKLKKMGIENPLNYLEEEAYEITDNYFITKNYSPYNNNNRMYFTVDNAARIDFIRLKLSEWKSKKLITNNEFSYLLASLIEAIPFISNISGTYGAYLKHWDKRALNKLTLKRLDIINNNLENKCYNLDSNDLIKKVSGDILYIDPPYNGRQYISNYHLLETVAKYDYPEIYGVTGLRPYENDKSKYCLKKEVSIALNDLIKHSKFKHILISYSSDGLLDKTEIEHILLNYGVESTYRLYEIPYRKYKSKHKQENNALYEYIFYIQKNLPNVDNVISNTKSISVCKYKEKKFVKSPLNYIGGKYKLLSQIMPLFPNEINTFVDLFCGGFNVGININARTIHGCDINNYVIEILSMIKEYEIDYIVNHIERRILEFNLSKENEEGFLKFRDYYNSNKNPLDLYTLICYSFNYQFRFNNNLEYNNPFGRNRSKFSDELKKKLIIFSNTLKEKNIEFINCEFENYNFDSLNKNDLVYCDPPYLITTGSYNDGNRGFKNWTLDQEHKLLNLLDSLNEKNIKFALSNVFEHKGKQNNILIEWSKKYNVIYLDSTYSNSSHNTSGESKEVLITNYLI